MSDIFNFADAWNNGATAFKGISLNVTNGSGGNPVYAAASRVFDFQKNGVSRIAADIDGAIYSRPSTGGAIATWLGDDVDADTGNFYFTVDDFPGVNSPASARSNVVWCFGYNVAPGGGRVDAAEPTLAFHFETYYHQGGTDPEAVLEWHLQSVDTGGTGHRMLTFFIPRDGASTTSRPRGDINTDIFGLGNYAGSNKIQYQFYNNSGNLAEIFHVSTAGARYIFDVNNTVIARQRNAANTDYLNLPYINSRNAIELPGFIEVQATSVNATYNAVALLALGGGATLADGQMALRLSMAAAPGANVNPFFSSIDSTGAVTFSNWNLGGGNASFEMRCATSGGDPTSVYNINGGGIFTVGIDNSDSDAFVVSANNGLGSNNRMRIDANTVQFPTLPPKITPVAVASLPSAATVGAGTKHVVNDANSPTFGATVSGGGSTLVPVYSDGTNWRVG